MSDELDGDGISGGVSGDEGLAHEIEEAPENPVEGTYDDDDERVALRAAAAAVGFRDERGRLMSGHPAQFKPGQSGNPSGPPTNAQRIEDFKAGRRKDLPAKVMTEALRAVLDDPQVRKKLAEKWVIQSSRNPGFAKLIMERLEGKVPFTLHVGPEIDNESTTDLGIEVVDVQVTSPEEVARIHDDHEGGS